MTADTIRRKQMKTIFKVAVLSISLVLMLIADVPFLPVNLVPEADAVLGVRRRAHRRGVAVGYTAGVASASAAASQTAAAQQQAAAQTAQTVPVGTVVQSLPGACTAVVVSGVSYSDCGGVFYKSAFQGNNLVYVVVEKPL